ncbi:MAG: lytic murein transglycosylase, partial [Desulfosalsimonadaceae bacterium]|nr:lytic murein transglycosylase [Desulfosalsimonadaceae bacterium]
MRNPFILSTDRLPSTICSYLILFVMLFPLSACASENDFNFTPLQNHLINDKEEKFTQEQISRLFNHPAVSFDIKGVSSYFQHRESTLNYDQFLSNESINNAKAYMRKNQASLLKAETDYGVDKEVITAIMLVETRLGTYVGNRSVLNILATMAVLEDKATRDRFWGEIPVKNRVSRAEYEKKALQKSQWAYKELKAFIKYVEKEGMEPYDIIGSYAGAMGIAQFMPSNILWLAEDGDKDGSINLFHHEDAIASIANYLRHYGWKPGINREQAGKVVHHYNHSSY